jgi:hypothetical protein
MGVGEIGIAKESERKRKRLPWKQKLSAHRVHESKVHNSTDSFRKDAEMAGL